jgi:hypothetical protein
LGDFLDWISWGKEGDFWGILWIGFHGGRKVKISPALQKFLARGKKKKKFLGGLERYTGEKRKKKKKSGG